MAGASLDLVFMGGTIGIFRVLQTDHYVPVGCVLIQQTLAYTRVGVGAVDFAVMEVDHHSRFFHVASERAFQHKQPPVDEQTDY